MSKKRLFELKRTTRKKFYKSKSSEIPLDQHQQYNTNNDPIHTKCNKSKS